MGAGRSEVLETIFGARTTASGGSVVDRRRAGRIRSPAEAKRAGLALVTEDRKRDGLVLDAGVDFNLALPVMQRLAAAVFVSRKAERDLADRQIQSLGDPDPRPAPGGRHPERRQPAEGGSRQMARNRSRASCCSMSRPAASTWARRRRSTA